MSLLTGKVAFITGASSGLGAATARHFATQGARVFIVGRNEEALSQTRAACQQAGAEVVAQTFDVGDRAACFVAIAACVDHFGQLDVLVNVAGKHYLHHSTEASLNDWRQDIDSNLSGPFFLSQAAIPHLLEQKGNIVNVASIAGLQGQAYSAGYCAAKHGLVGLTKALALEYAKTDLRVNVICPGGMDTPQVSSLQMPEGIDFELLMRSAGLRGMMTPEEVAPVIAFLASDSASAIHGAVYPVDKGKTVG
ncbi:MAG: SDR family oxidoreductase [Proteobacteria bacterium]|nr:SDR family oxidoreductase [Pseudomonadota bacterium]